MIPKSRFYNLVMSWRNKPFRELRDIERSEWQDGTPKDKIMVSEGITSINPSKNPYRGTHFEPIFNLPGSTLKGVLYRPLIRRSSQSSI